VEPHDHGEGLHPVLDTRHEAEAHAGPRQERFGLADEDGPLPQLVDAHEDRVHTRNLGAGRDEGQPAA
jgi:hypothetical protein